MKSWEKGRLIYEKYAVPLERMDGVACVMAGCLRLDQMETNAIYLGYTAGAIGDKWGSATRDEDKTGYHRMIWTGVDFRDFDDDGIMDHDHPQSFTNDRNPDVFIPIKKSKRKLK